LIEPLPVRLKDIHGTRYEQILAYPTADQAQADTRLRELKSIGVTAIRFTGHTTIGGIPILGKGCVGIVTQAIIEGKPVAVKMRRLDADRPSMDEEARLLRLANAVEVGPRLVAATRNLLAMELFEGVPLFRWAEGSARRNMDLKRVLSLLLDACFRLDAVGLDHGELSHAPKNVLVDHTGQACIVDFESASMVRRVANVTSLLQYFMFGRISRSLHTSRVFHEKRRLLTDLSRYKEEGSIDSYRNLLHTLNLR
jgi:putative serine/threonine protein kinase